jgi:hypothetical protein
MIGDSVLYGALGEGTGPLGCGRVSPHPQEVLNSHQGVFDFCYNYAMPGASFAGVLSADSLIRTANGMPNGVPLFDLLEDVHPDAGAVLINLGGNDFSGATLISNIDIVADICKYQNKLFAFVGLVDICVKESIENTNYTGDILPYLEQTGRFAYNSDTLKQVCVIKGYPYVDIRNNVKHDLVGITGDLVHPNQAYSEAIFTHVAKAITGQI